MEEALWNLEEKFKVSTHKAIALFACTSFLLLGVCVAAAALRRRKSSHVHQEPCKDGGGVVEPPPEQRRKWEEEKVRGSERELEASCKINIGGIMEVGWQSHNSSSGVWQRPILMGEKCELPRFSGLILYDLKGIPLHHHHQEIMSTPVVRTTLRDLL